MKKIMDYIKDKKETKPVQVEIECNILTEVWKVLKENNITMRQLITASFIKFLEENRVKKN